MKRAMCTAVQPASCVLSPKLYKEAVLLRTRPDQCVTTTGAPETVLAWSS